MDLLELIDTLEEAIERSASIPLSGKSLVDKDELLDLIEEIRLKMPEDLKQAKWVKEERQRILHEAQKEVNTIVKSAEDKLISMINEHEITQQAQEKAEEIIENAKNTAKEIRVGVRQYSNDILADLEDVVDEIKGTLHKSLSDVRESVDSIDDALKIIDENRNELSK